MPERVGVVSGRDRANYQGIDRGLARTVNESLLFQSLLCTKEYAGRFFYGRMRATFLIPATTMNLADVCFLPAEFD